MTTDESQSRWTFPQRPRVRGREFPGWVEPIEELKRQERHSEALELLMECIEAAEMDEQRIFPAPWYSWQAAVIFRKQREYQKEVEVLERWVNALPAIYDLSKWGASARRMFPRLERAREIARRMGAES